MTNSSFFISFEGIEGSGKSTQMALLSHELTQKGYAVHTLREPGATEMGEKIRSLILQSAHPLSPTTELFLFMAARSELIQTKLIPLLKTPKTIVLLDRYFHSSMAYQGIARGLGFDYVEKMHSFPPFNLTPDLTFYLRIDLKTSLARQAKRGQEKDYFEKEKNDFHQKLIDAYDALSKKYHYFLTIDASKDQPEV